MTEDSGAEWFRYVGSILKLTREFCDLMTDKGLFHVSEIPELLKVISMVKSARFTIKRNYQKE